MKKTIFSSILLFSIASSNEFTKIQENKNLNISIYNNNLAMVNEQRSMDIYQNGKQKLVYEGIASSVIFESIVPKFSQKTLLYSQNYQYDVLSLNKLLQKSINKKIQYKRYTSEFEYEKKEAILLSINPILLKKENEIVSGISPKDIIFDKIPDDLLTKPSLIWNTKSLKGKQDIMLSYLTKGISWKSDYVLNLDDLNTLKAWITITNNSGATYKDANIYCIAGNVKTQNVRRQYNNKVMRLGESFAMAGNMDVQQKQFSGYNLYKIPFKETIYNQQKKQINFINKSNIKVKSLAKTSNGIFLHRFKEIKNQKFKHIIEFKNIKENNLGIALPAGIIRVYKKGDEISHFIGQDNIGHTSNKEKISLHVGDFFDISQDIKQLEFRSTKLEIKSKYKRTIKNNTNKNQTIVISENSYSSNIRRLSNENNCINNCNVEKIGISNYKYTIQLKPKESYILINKYNLEYERVSR